MQQQPLMSRFWLSAWALTAALAWLLPNHYLPWTAFHLDAWMATTCLLAAAAVLVRSPGTSPLQPLPAVALLLAVVPLVQWWAGQIHHAGVAWMHAFYLFGLCLAILIGSRWERQSPDQPADALFVAVGIAAFISVGLQFYQWLRLDGLEVWVMPDRFNRPFGNLGQPNQLATLHLWGLIALAWAYCRAQIRPAVALAGALFLLYGLAMTASRASWIGLAWLVLASWVWRRLWPSRSVPWAVTLLAAWFAITVPSVSFLRELILGGDPSELQELTRVAVVGENRPAIWSMFFGALLRAPWLGYGWGQIQWAQLAVALDHTPKFSYFAHAHNLALDLMLWMGIPLGLSVVAFLGHWLWRQLRAADRAGTALIALLVLVTVNHAMFELPLHYGYFLWPIGLMAGILEARRGGAPWGHLPRWTVAIGGLMAAAMLALVLRDYSRVEPEYQKLRFEWARIKTDPAQPPDVLLLDQFRGFIEAVRVEPRAGMSRSELEALARIAHEFPSPAMLQKLARAQALNAQTSEAARTLRTMCSIVAPPLCRGVQLAWVDEARERPAIAAVPWPPR